MNKSHRGVALVEFALMLPMLLLLTVITTEFGRAIYQYNTLAKSVRDASRYLSMQTPGTQMTQARNLVVHGNLAGTGPVLVDGLNGSNVPNPTWQTAGADPIITTVTVQVSGYTFRPMFSSVLGVQFFSGGGITFSDIRATMRSHVEPVAP
ncbi:TadE/TadG family type IV pilus assembly protein [Caenimonas soli]|uniref:TadE/TadG family type IV pilus assembly protein n=1 Tax=Caenimonas soli TaxID=2735555 RepID=UPI00155360C8|nr:TadE family protein [Caenimonas soli]NPC55468.1 pilus assembly protein [Caenimonas soli]